MKGLIPYYCFEINSGRSPEDVLALLNELVDDPGTDTSMRESWNKIFSPFIGRISGSSFSFYHVLGYRNPVRPQIRGQVVEAGSGSQVTVTMIPLAVGILLSLLWFGWFLGYLGGRQLVQLFQGRPANEWDVPLAMTVLGYLLLEVGFWTDAVASRKRLEGELRT